MRRLLLALALACGTLTCGWLATAVHADPYRPPAFVLYGHGEGGDGLGYGFQDGYVSQRTREYQPRPDGPDVGPWGRYDNSVPGYRAHGMRFSHSFYGHTPTDLRVEYIGDKRERGRHEAIRTYDRHGNVVYITDDR